MSALKLVFALAGALWLADAAAVPTIAPFVDTPPCDTHAITLTHELGNPPAAGSFPPDEAIDSASTPVQQQGCSTFVQPNGILDWVVTITNLTSTHWVDLFFVADADKSYGNVDGLILGGLAFRIDGVGINVPLLAESLAPDLVFEPGETWTFLVIDWDPGANGGPPSLMGSIGVGVGSVTDPSSTASIVANPRLRVPEPATELLIGAALLAGWRLRRRGR